MRVDETTFADAAAFVAELDSDADFAGSGDIDLGVGFASAPQGAGFGRQGRIRAVREFRVDDAVLDVARMALFKDRRLIADSVYLITDHARQTAQVLDNRVVAAPPGETILVGCNRARENYYHWMIQALPAIDLSLHQKRDRAVRLALPRLTALQEDSLTYLGHGKVPRLLLDQDHQYALPQASYCEYLNGSRAFGLSRAAVGTWHRLRLAVPPRFSPHRWIYLARTDTRNRVAANEAALIDLLRNEGVHVVMPGSYSLEDQITLFRNARAVIAPHGAGLSNIVFCQKGTLIYEMLPHHYPNVCFNRLAQICELDYCADMFRAEETGGTHDRRWWIDLGVVSERLATLRRRYG